MGRLSGARGRLLEALKRLQSAHCQFEVTENERGETGEVSIESRGERGEGRGESVLISKGQYDHPEILSCLHSLGVVSSLLGEYKSAREYFDTAIEGNSGLSPLPSSTLVWVRVRVTLTTLTFILLA